MTEQTDHHEASQGRASSSRGAQDAQETPSGAQRDTNGQESAHDAPRPAEDDAQDLEDGQEAPELRKLRNEAAARRTAAREAREEADGLRAQVTALQDAQLKQQLAKHYVSFDAFTAAGARDKVFNDDGTLNADAVAKEAAAVAQRFGTVGRPATPDPNLGRETPPGAPEKPHSWADKIRSH